MDVRNSKLDMATETADQKDVKATPLQGEDKATPLQGEDKSTPLQGEDNATPLQGEGKANPQLGEDKFAPHRREDVAIPQEVEDEAISLQEENKNTPQPGENKTTPLLEEDKASPESQGLINDEYHSLDQKEGSSEFKSEISTSLSAASDNGSPLSAASDSEYETLEEDNGSDLSSKGSQLSREDEDNLSDSIIVENEREDGDGQESSSLKDKKLDDDEDRRNPQYIPKKGTFYEHDDRTTLEESVSQKEENEGEEEREGGKKGGRVWKEKGDRWHHDLYVEDQQSPKSRQELIDTYGYDIRNEEAPPKARRRRRYGRGPNKYTRNWEDEEAYGRGGPGSVASPPPRRPLSNNKAEFPPLDRGDILEINPLSTLGSALAVEKCVKYPAPGPRGDSEVVLPGYSKEETIHKISDQLQSNGFMSQPRRVRGGGAGLIVKGGLGRPAMEFIASRGHGRGRGWRNSPAHQQPRRDPQLPKHGDQQPRWDDQQPRRDDQQPKWDDQHPKREDKLLMQVDMKQAVAALQNDFSHVHITVEDIKPPPVCEAPQETSSRSKRYSTQRQRAMPESQPTYSPPPQPPISFYQQQPPPQPGYSTTGPLYSEGTPPPPPPLQMMFLPPPGPPPPPPQFVSPTPPLSVPPPPIINYVTAPHAPYAIPLQQAGPQTELYQVQPSGITYYSTQTQAVAPRPTPQRRVKLAIPIVPPPPLSQPPRGRGRSNGEPSNNVQQYHEQDTFA